MKNIRIIFVVLTFIVAASITEKGFTMSMLFPSKVIPFSGFEGVLTENGTPLVGVEVIRSYDLKGVDVTDSATTDGEGRFVFQTIEESIRAPFFAQFSVKQRVVAVVNGEPRQIWYGAKLDEAEYAEFGGEPGRVSCDLAYNDIIVEHGISFAETKCRWGQMNEG